MAAYAHSTGSTGQLEYITPPLRHQFRPEVVFVFCGNGAGRADLVARCQGLPQRADAADLVMRRPIHIDLVIAKPRTTRMGWVGQYSGELIESAVCAQNAHMKGQKHFNWNPEKNQVLLRERGISFERIVFEIASGNELAVLEHPNQEKYPGQKISMVQVEDYVCAVPFIETDLEIFLRTIIPSRKATKQNRSSL
jgi:uncharacterized DUF497 family protein